jgi:gamma-glutamyltranspeptidase/glutathione hydrolase
MSGGERVVADITLPAAELEALKAAFPVVGARRTIYPDAFARPSAVMRSNGVNMGCTEVMSPWADTVHENSGSEP